MLLRLQDSLSAPYRQSCRCVSQLELSLHPVGPMQEMQRSRHGRLMQMRACGRKLTLLHHLMQDSCNYV